MDFYLKGIDNGWESTPRVRTSLLRFNAPPISERPETEFPIPRTVYKPFYLDAGSHTLSEKMPATANKVSYPSADFSSIASFSITFDQPTEINGHAKIKLWHSHDTGSDAEVYAILRKVDKEGKALRNSNIPLEDTPEVKSVDDLEDINTLVYHGPSAILRLSYRATDPSRALSPGEVFHPFDKPEPVAAGEVIEFEMGFWATGIAFEAGESLRVDIAGFDLRPPEFEPLRGFLKSDINEGTHTLYTGPDHPAVLTLPIV